MRGEYIYGIRPKISHSRLISLTGHVCPSEWSRPIEWLNTVDVVWWLPMRQLLPTRKRSRRVWMYGAIGSVLAECWFICSRWSTQPQYCYTYRIHPMRFLLFDFLMSVTMQNHSTSSQHPELVTLTYTFTGNITSSQSSESIWEVIWSWLPQTDIQISWNSILPPCVLLAETPISTLTSVSRSSRVSES